MDGDPSGIGILGRCVIERRFEPASECLRRSSIWTRHVGWRHLASAEFVEHFFPDFAAATDIPQIDAFKRDLCGPKPVVVTDYAILIE
jgi:hypothetical protein